MTAAYASARLELKRLTRSGLLFGLIATFAFFGLSGPALALFMPEIMGAATNTEQFTIEAKPATPFDGLMMFNQSAMQLGLILAVAVAITALGWDARPGSSIFYRVRVRHLSVLTVPRFVVAALVATSSYALGLVSAIVLTNLMIGEVPADLSWKVGLASVAYLVMSMAIGHLIMTLTRRTASAIAFAAILVLILPLISQLPAISAWVPTALLGAAMLDAGKLVLPAIVALGVTVACLIASGLVAGRQALRREA